MANLKAAIAIVLEDEVTGNARGIETALGRVESAAVEAGQDGARALDQLENAAQRTGTSLSRAAGVASNAGSGLGALNDGARGTAGALEQASASSGGFLRRMFSVTDASKKQGYALAGQVNAVAELAYGFGNLSPATRGLGLAFVMAGGSAFSFAGILGPLGVVLGVLIGLVPGVIDFFRRMGDEAEDATEDVDGFTQSIDNQIAAMKRLRREHSIRDAEGTREETEARLVALRQERAQAQAEASRATRQLSPEQRQAMEIAQRQGDTSVEALARILQERAEARGDTQGNVQLRSRAQAFGIEDALQARQRAARFDDSELRAQEARLRELEAEAQQEQREDLVQERQRIRDAATAEADSVVQGLGLDERLSERLREQIGEGRFRQGDLDRLTPAQREQVMGAATDVVRANQGVDLAERSARRGLLERIQGDALEGEALATGDQLTATPTVRAGGGGGADAFRTELVTARSGTGGDPELRRTLEEQLANQREQLRQTERLIDEVARGGGGGSRGPDTLGGGE